MKLDINAPANRQPPALERAKNPKNRRLASEGYVTYLRNPELHSNSAFNYAGYGDTPEASYVNACYWANQIAWVTTVPFRRAPKWAQEEAVASRDPEFDF